MFYPILKSMLMLGLLPFIVNMLHLEVILTIVIIVLKTFVQVVVNTVFQSNIQVAV